MKVRFDALGGRTGLGGLGLKVAKNTLATFTDESEAVFTNFMSQAASYGLARLQFRILENKVYKTGALYASAYKVEPPNKKIRKQYADAPTTVQSKQAVSPRSFKNYRASVKASRKIKPKLGTSDKLDENNRPLAGTRPSLKPKSSPYLPPVPTNSTTAYSAIGVSIYYAIFPHDGLSNHAGKGPRPFVDEAMGDVEFAFGPMLKEMITTLARRKSAKSSKN
jgi:hypothetical protein